jgi:hypothetical protein
MSVRVTAATARRVLWQIRHDPRTVALLLVVPCVLLVLLRYVFDGRPHVFQQLGAPLCGLFPFIVMFLVTSITMLRERTTGTLERLMTLPLAKLDLLAGYAISFGLLAALQAATICVVGFALLGLRATRHGAGTAGQRVRPNRAQGADAARFQTNGGSRVTMRDRSRSVGLTASNLTGPTRDERMGLTTANRSGRVAKWPRG